MVIIKSFALNFVISLIVFLAASFIGLLFWIGIMWGIYGGWLRDILRLGSDMPAPVWVFESIVWGSFLLNIGISGVIFFFAGKKLILLGNHCLNYLSISCSLIIAIVLGFLQPQLVFYTTFPFIMLLEIIDWYILRSGSSFYDINLIFIIATLPSIITWLAMLYQSRQKKQPATD